MGGHPANWSLRANLCDTRSAVLGHGHNFRLTMPVEHRDAAFYKLGSSWPIGPADGRGLRPEITSGLNKVVLPMMEKLLTHPLTDKLPQTYISHV